MICGWLHLIYLLLWFTGKDMRIIVFGFRPRTKQVSHPGVRKLIYLIFFTYSWWWFVIPYGISSFSSLVGFIYLVILILQMIMQRRAVFDALVRCVRPTRLWDHYAFVVGPSRFSNMSPKVRLLNEYFRLLGLGSNHASTETIEDGSFTLSNEWWRISSVNSNYTMCATYPFALLTPNSIR